MASTGGTKLVRGRVVLADPDRLPDDGLIDDGAVIVEADSIAAIGPYDRLRKSCPDAEQIGSDRHAVIPGLINAHQHGRGLTPLQLGVPDDLLDTYLVDFLALAPLDVYLDTLHANLRLLRSGVTTVIHSGIVRDPTQLAAESQATLRAYDDAGLRACYAVPLQDLSNLVYLNEQAFFDALPGDLGTRLRAALDEGGLTDADAGFALMEKLLEEYADHPRLRVLAGPTGPEWSSDGLLEKLRTFSEKTGAGVHMHCAESAIQRDAAFHLYGKSSTTRLDDFGLLGPGTALAHGTWMDEADIELCAARGVNVCHNASSNLRLHMGVAPVSRMVEQGINVAIGTDGYTINSDDDFLQEIRLVNTLHRLPRGRSPLPAPRPADTIRMATVNGARAAGLDGRIGRLAPGCKADMVLLDLSAMTSPYIDPDVGFADVLVALASPRHVETVLVGGEVVYTNGSHPHVDADEVAEKLGRVAARPRDPAFADFAALVHELRPHVAGYYRDWTWRTGLSADYIPNTAGGRADRRGTS